MSKQQEAKKIAVGEIVEVIKNSKSFVVFEYTTLTGKQITELRKNLYQHNAQMHVYKNTLLKRALDGAGINFNESDLTNANATIFMNDENIDGFKDLADLLKARKEANPDIKDIVIKFGFYENNLIDSNMVKTLFTLPSRNDLYSMIASALQSPIRNLAYAIKQVSDSKQA